MELTNEKLTYSEVDAQLKASKYRIKLKTERENIVPHQYCLFLHQKKTKKV